MAYSMEFRRVVAKAYDECGSSIEVAEQLECSESCRAIRSPMKPMTTSSSTSVKPSCAQATWAISDW